MRLIYAAFFLSCFAIAIYFSMSSWVATPPQAAATAFLQTVSSGDLAASAELFGDNSCRCPPKGGYASLLKYESGADPNLAFLLGHPFTVGTPRVSWLKDTNEYILPWEVPESTYVDVPLSFSSKAYSPYFLPLDLAYGHAMTIEKLDQALNHIQEDDWKGFSIRLRAGLQPGLVPSPKDEVHTSQGSNRKNDQELMQELLGPHAALYIVPKDAGKVVLPDGKFLSTESLELKLPRLKSVTIRLNVVRRGQFKPWRIARFKFMDAVVQIEDKQPITLLTPLASTTNP